jgi:hypothetical protein
MIQMPDVPKPDFGQLGDFGDDIGVLEDIEPEVVDGPLGLPLVKPKGAPDPPDVMDGDSPLDRF